MGRNDPSAAIDCGRNKNVTKTAYGLQTSLFVPRIRSLGYEIQMDANWGLQGGIANVEEGQIFPALTSHRDDHTLLPGHARTFKADIVISLYDTWTFPAAIVNQFRWIPMVIVDLDRVSRRLFNSLQPAWAIIAITRYGEEKLKEAGFEPYYVPLAVDTKLFRPSDKKTARKKIGFPGTDFIALMVSANKAFPSRKAIPEVLAAWSHFIKDHPDSHLHLHTNPFPMHSGIEVVEIVKGLGLDNGSVSAADPYLISCGYPLEYMVDLYNAADVLLLPSYAEGFGLPLIEAAATGTPVITSKWGPMPELLSSGWSVNGQPFWAQLGGWQRVPYIHEIITALEKAYECRDDKGMADESREFALKYDADVVTKKYWKPVLEKIEESLLFESMAKAKTRPTDRSVQDTLALPKKK